jgi:putative SbcD/Mre11-related phosphoesterase
MLEIYPGVFAKDLGLFIKASNTIIFADFHLGYEEALNKQGILVPRLSFEDICNRLKPLLTRPYGTIIVNGDIKHEFGSISRQEWRETGALLELLRKSCRRLVLIKGNHDTIIGPISSDAEILDHIIIDGMYITHGHTLPGDRDFQKAKAIVIAHEHPAVVLRDKFRSERYKCFLVGKYKGRALIVMPSFNLLSPGTDVSKERLLSPFLKQDLSGFDVYIVGDRLYHFGKLKELL